VNPTAIAATRHAKTAVPVRSAIGAWLLDGPARVRSGPHAGAIAGVVCTSGAVAYVYPEIAGYYLQWLAWRAREGDARGPLAERACALQRWLGRWLADATPPRTRLHFDGLDDWRNQAVFCFDLAMVLRGLGSSAQAGLIAIDEHVAAGVGGELERLIGADGAFEACLANHPAAALPDRWSTRRGPFLEKAAAGIITAAEVIPALPRRVLQAAEATFDASVAALARAPHAELHPLLYACEGVMALPGHRDFARALATVAARFDALAGLAAGGAMLPEAHTAEGGRSGPARIDVVAQALRINSLLDAHLPGRTTDRRALSRLRDTLEQEVRPSGALPFAFGVEPLQWNTWAAMFADQALGLADAASSLRARRDSDPLIV
jgi:hypothetical protein